MSENNGQQFKIGKLTQAIEDMVGRFDRFEKHYGDHMKTNKYEHKALEKKMWKAVIIAVLAAGVMATASPRLFEEILKALI